MRIGYVVRVAVAVLAIGGLLTAFGIQTFPRLPAWEILAWVAGSVLGALALLVLGILYFAHSGQWALRHGATDPAWFWFKGEPPGLAGQREQADAERRD